MSRLRLGGAGALALTLLATLLFPPAVLGYRPIPPADRAYLDGIGTDTHAKCTGWTSEVTPPTSIRVLRSALHEKYDSSGRHPEWRVPAHVVGTVQTVPFRKYVETVMGVEWGPDRSLETLKAAAIAVKQYGWYYAMNGRSSYVTSSGACYDVKDYNVDQIYWPERGYTKDYHRDVVGQTWRTSLRQNIVINSRTGEQALRFFLTGYRSGSDVACGADADGFKLRAKSAYRCGTELGYSRESIQRRYYKSSLQIVTPGFGHAVGGIGGDAITLLSASGLDPVSVAVMPGGSTFGTPLRNSLGLPSSRVEGVASGDVDGDGRDDLVVLDRRDRGTRELKVLRATADGYAAPVTWWTNSTGPAFVSPLTRLAVGDFDGDARSDIALLVSGTTDELSFLRSTGSGFSAGVRWWQGSLDVDATTVSAHDVTGDGRADLVTRTAFDDRVETHVYPSVAGVPGTNAVRPLAARALWLTQDEAGGASGPQVFADLDRDGRIDLITGQDAPAGVALRWHRSTGTAFAAARTVWSPPAEAPIRLGELSLGSADVNGDGFGDVLLYQPEGTGTRVRALLSHLGVAGGATLAAGATAVDPSLSFVAAEPL